MQTHIEMSWAQHTTTHKNGSRWQNTVGSVCAFGRSQMVRNDKGVIRGEIGDMS